MYSTKRSFKSLILVASLILYSVNQVSSLSCYVCASTIDGRCYNNSKQDYNKVECNNMNTIPQFEQNMFSRIGMTVQSVLQNYTGVGHKCLTLTGEVAHQKSVLRTCTPNAITCDSWKGIMQLTHGLTVESCDTCESELCNSSHQLGVGFFSLIVSLLTLLWTRI